MVVQRKAELSHYDDQHFNRSVKHGSNFEDFDIFMSATVIKQQCKIQFHEH